MAAALQDEWDSVSSPVNSGGDEWADVSSPVSASPAATAEKTKQNGNAGMMGGIAGVLGLADNPTMRDVAASAAAGVPQGIEGMANLPQNIVNIPLKHIMTGLMGIPEDQVHKYLAPTMRQLFSGPDKMRDTPATYTGDLYHPQTALGSMANAAAQAMSGNELAGAPVGAETAAMSGLGALGGSEAAHVVAPGWEDVGGLIGGSGAAMAVPAAQAGIRGAFRNESSIPQMQENIQNFESQGLSPTVGQATEGFAPRGVENALSKIPGGAGVMRKAAEAQQDALGNRVDQISSQLSQGATAEKTGRSIERGIKENFIPQARDVQSNLYDRIDRYIAPDDIVPVSNSLEALNRLTATIKGAAQTSATLTNPKLQQIYDAFNADIYGNPSAGATIKTRYGEQPMMDINTGPSIKTKYGEQPMMSRRQGLPLPKSSQPTDFKYDWSTGKQVPVVPPQTDTNFRIRDFGDVPKSTYDWTTGKTTGSNPEVVGTTVTPGVKEGTAPKSSYDWTTGKTTTDKPEINGITVSPGAPDIKGNARYDWTTGKTINEGLPYSAVKQIRTKIGSMLEDVGLAADVPKSELKQIYAALSQDMESAVRGSGSNSAVDAWNRANNYTKALHDRIDTLQSVIDRNGGPEKVFAAATSGTGDGATTLRAVMKSIPPESQKMMSATVLRRLGRATPGNQNDVGNVFSTSTFLTNWNKMSPEAKSTLFDRYGSGFRNDLDKVANIASNFKDGTKVFANPSGTAQAEKNISNLTKFAAATGAIMHSPLILGGVAAELTGSYAGARLMTNPKFVKWLAQNGDKPIKNLPGALTSLSITANKQNDYDMKAFIKAQKERMQENRP